MEEDQAFKASLGYILYSRFVASLGCMRFCLIKMKCGRLTVQ